jgi:hypothetical protein
MPTDNKQSQTNGLPPVPTDDMSPLVVEDTTPPMLNDNDLPVVNTPPTITVEEKPSETSSGSAAPSDDVVMAPIVTTQKKKFAGGKVIATILGLFLLVGGLGAGTMLVQQNQNIEEKANFCVDSCVNGGGGPLACECECGFRNSRCPAGEGEPGENNCDRQCGGPGLAFDFCMPNSSPLTCNQEALNRGYVVPIGSGCQPGQNCTVPAGYICRVGVNGYTGGPCTNDNKVPGTGTITSVPNCFCGTIQIDGGPNDGTYTMQCGCGGDGTPSATTPPTTPPAIDASCQNIKAYNMSWEELSSQRLATLKPGNRINFCVAGVASSGSFTKAKIKINGVALPETTTKRPNSNDFCSNYTITSAITTYRVTANIFHETLGWK